MPSQLFIDRPLTALSPELLRAARWIEDNLRDVALQSMRECARRADLTPTTFSRLARALGFGGFSEIKTRCQQALDENPRYSTRARALQSRARRGPDWFEALNEAQHANSASISELNSRDQFERAADAMIDAGQVHFLGLRASHGLAFHLHYTYGLIATNGILLQGLGGTLADQLGQIVRNDLLVAISLSPYTRQTVDSVTRAAAQGVKILALTDSALAPIAASASHVLRFRAQSPSFFHSMVGGLAVAEALVAAVAVRGGRKVLSHLHKVQQRLDAQHAYWEKRPNPSHDPVKPIRHR